MGFFSDRFGKKKSQDDFSSDQSRIRVVSISSNQACDLRTEDDLNLEMNNGLISKSIVLRGKYLLSLNELEIIDGDLGISDSNIQDLGNLKEILGDFWISYSAVTPSLKSLGFLEKVIGDVNLRYSNVSSLGNLAEVGGRLSLRDTPISDLSKLRTVGGDLYLPKHAQNVIPIEHIEVKGRVRYWNDSKTKVTLNEKHKTELIHLDQPVPYWEHKYIRSKDDLDYVDDSKVKLFYQEFKGRFENNQFLDLDGNDNYAFVLMFDLLEQVEIQGPEIIEIRLGNLAKHYPPTSNYCELFLIEYYESRRSYHEAWRIKKDRGYIGLKDIIDYQAYLKTNLLDGALVSKMAGTSHLTRFGRDNIKKVRAYVKEVVEAIELQTGCSFFEQFANNVKDFESVVTRTKGLELSGSQDLGYYKQFFVSSTEYERHAPLPKINYANGLYPIVEGAILNQLRVVLKQAEDLYREAIGMPKVGEGWISETELYYKIVEAFPAYKVTQHASPNWLGRQHLDVYFSDPMIGVEYQGAQHYEAVDFFGGEEALKKTQERDERKRLICSENKCELIYVDEGYDFEKVRAKIVSLLGSP
ncbi:MAG: hypothetical protein ACI85F_002871 [Bacteroidia bacterium]|jgi:hypothetical protein